MTMKQPAPPPTLETFVAWLATKNPNQPYAWEDPVNCLVGHYLIDHQRNWGEFTYSDIPHYHEIAQAKPWTMGAALERARAQLALPAPTETPVEIPAEAAPEVADLTHIPVEVLNNSNNEMPNDQKLIENQHA